MFARNPELVITPVLDAARSGEVDRSQLSPAGVKLLKAILDPSRIYHLPDCVRIRIRNRRSEAELLIASGASPLYVENVRRMYGEALDRRRESFIRFNPRRGTEGGWVRGADGNHEKRIETVEEYLNRYAADYLADADIIPEALFAKVSK